jgi:hypothetical protein
MEKLSFKKFHVKVVLKLEVYRYLHIWETPTPLRGQDHGKERRKKKEEKEENLKNEEWTNI